MILIRFFEKRIKYNTLSINYYIIFIIILFLPVFNFSKVENPESFSIASYYLTVTQVISFLINLITILFCKSQQKDIDIGNFLRKIIPIFILVRIELNLLFSIPIAVISTNLAKVISNFHLVNNITTIIITLITNFLFFIFTIKAFSRVSQKEIVKRIDIDA